MAHKRYYRHYDGANHKAIFASLRKSYEDGLTNIPRRYNKHAVKNSVEVKAVYYLDINEKWNAYITCYVAEGLFHIMIQSNNFDEHYGKWATAYTQYHMNTKEDANERFRSIVNTAKASGMACMKKIA